MKTKRYMKHSHKKSFVVLWTVLACIVVLVAILSSLVAMALTNDVIANGIYVDDIHIGKMTAEEAAVEIAEHYSQPIDSMLTLQCGTTEKEIRLKDLACEVDVEATVKRAYDYGRNGNIFNRLKEIYTIKQDGLVLAPILACDDVLLETYLGELATLIDHPGQEMMLSLDGETLTITRGIPGNFIDIPEAMTQFKESALLLKDKPFVLTAKEMKPKEPNAKDIHAEICGDPVDASYKIENQQLTIVEEKPGVSFDITAVQTIIDQTPGDVITVPVTVVPAQVTAEQIKNQLFVDLLGTYTSKYNAGDVSRSHNVSLAAKKINEVVLAPGDVFSYNETVGPRTAARGFKTANVYVGNRVEPGIGGGICQVSSTLFNAVVLADLNIVYRTNHSLPVTYVPLGRDATVSYGSIDFKFSNNTGHPVKIVASAAGGYNKVSIYGVKENKNKTIEISTEQVGSRAYQVTQKEDPTLPEGTVKIEQKGSYGSSFNTYKITKENGKVVKTEFLTKSTYVPTDQIEIIGTQPVPSDTPSPEPEVPVSGEVTETPAPIDKPTNTPIPILPPNAGESTPVPPASASPTPAVEPTTVPTEE